MLRTKEQFEGFKKQVIGQLATFIQELEDVKMEVMQ
jgi:hypothetical protein